MRTSPAPTVRMLQISTLLRWKIDRVLVGRRQLPVTRSPHPHCVPFAEGGEHRSLHGLSWARKNECTELRCVPEGPKCGCIWLGSAKRAPAVEWRAAAGAWCGALIPFAGRAAGRMAWVPVAWQDVAMNPRIHRIEPSRPEKRVHGRVERVKIQRIHSLHAPYEGSRVLAGDHFIDYAEWARYFHGSVQTCKNGL